MHVLFAKVIVRSIWTTVTRSVCAGTRLQLRRQAAKQGPIGNWETFRPSHRYDVSEQSLFFCDALRIFVAQALQRYLSSLDRSKRNPVYPRGILCLAINHSPSSRFRSQIRSRLDAYYVDFTDG